MWSNRTVYDILLIISAKSKVLYSTSLPFTIMNEGGLSLPPHPSGEKTRLRCFFLTLTLHLAETRIKSIFFKLKYAILPLHSLP